jgi:hypothetical protein
MNYGLLFLLARIVLIISLPMDGLRSYGDHWNFFHIASLGTPFIDLWVEFPPIFPFLSRGFYLISSGREHTYIYLLAVFFSIVQAGNIYLFHDISKKVWNDNEAGQRVLVYGAMLFGLFYGWTYFDCLGVFLLLWGLRAILNKHEWKAGVIIALGGLVKWFPVLLLPAAWRKLGQKKGLQVVLSAVIIIVLVWGTLYLVSSENTYASMLSQSIKGSWETIWALIDGNLTTGNFGSQVDRLDPNTAMIGQGNPPVVPSWATLLLFGTIGFIVFLRSNLDDEKKLISFVGFTFVMFFLWSPGYSPQWVLFLLPLVLLSFEGLRSTLLGLILVIVNLLEWPLLLSRGWFHLLEEIVIGRTVIYMILAILLAGNLIKNDGGSDTKNAL